ncbi:MAG TPA: pyrimidine 5'-nucleotidase [Alphaproteobacteria bacterium]|nr:pyrimidine 5'-nucleotidase [Alphaproteobacteria bacterium]
MHPLAQTRAWIFDLDNTLYSPHSDIFPQIHRRMSEFIMQRFSMDEEAAGKQREDYFYRYGTTMRGLMAEHKVDPIDFMNFVHDVDLSAVAPEPRLARALENLPGRKLVFTNADRRHAKRILDHLNLTALFPDIFDIADGNYLCKPETAPYEALLQRYGLNAADCCMVEDMEANLRPAAALGMRTLWRRHDAAWLRHKPKEAHFYPHCHYITDDLIPFLENLHRVAA